jgi:hypothetical protein
MPRESIIRKVRDAIRQDDEDEFVSDNWTALPLLPSHPMNSCQFR